MYLLDNVNKSIKWDTLKHLYDNIENVDSLRDNLFKKNNLNTILNKINIKNKFVKSESTANNLKNLFRNQPLNLNEKETDEIFLNLNININVISNKNKYSFSNKDIDSIFSKYGNLIVNKIKTLENTSSYDIVGMIHKSINPLCYGKEIYNKKDMDSLLYFIDQKNINNSINNDFDSNNLKEKISNLIEKTFNDGYSKEQALYFLNNDNLNEAMNLASNKITEINKNSFKNANRNKIIEYKDEYYKYKYNAFILKFKDLNFGNNSIGQKIKDNIETMLSNKFSLEQLYNYLGTINDDIKNANQYLEKTISDLDNANLNSDIKNNLINKTKSEMNTIESLKLDLIEIINFESTITDVSLTKYVQDLNNLKTEYKINIMKDKQINSINDLKNIKLNQAKEYTSILSDYQEINKELLNNKDYINNHINKNSLFLNNLNNNIDNNIEKENVFELLKIKDISKYKLEDVKQLYLLINSDNKTIYNISKTTNLLKDIDKNLLFKNIFNNKFPEMNSDIFKRINYIYDVLVLQKDINKLISQDLTIDINKYLFKFHDGKSLFKKDNIDFISNKFNELKNEPIFKNKPNILMASIIYSFNNENESFSFNQENFDVLKKILTTNKNEIFKDNDLVDSLNSINDNWLKWSLVYNREIKDVKLTEIGLDIKNFDFASFNDMKKSIIDYKNNYLKDEEFKFDNNFHHVLEFYKLFDNNIDFEKTINLFKHFETLPEKMQNFFINSCKDISKISNSEMFKIFYKPEISKDISNIYKFIDSTIKTNYFESKFKVIDLKKDFIYLYRQMLNIELGDKNYKYGINDLKKLDVLFKNNLNFDIKSTINVLKKVNKNIIEKMVDYYNLNYKKHNIESFDLKDSKIPILSKQLDNQYSYKVLTIKNFDTLLAGEKSNCCMSLDGAGWGIYKHMFENPKTSMLFEVYKNGIAIANSWVWKQGGQLTFDNIETIDSNGTELRNSVKQAYYDYSLSSMLESNEIEHITYGLGNGDVTNIGIQKSGSPLNNYSKYYSHGDSNSQKTLLCNKNILSSSYIKPLIDEAEKNNVDQDLINKFVNKFYYEINHSNSLDR